MTIRVLCQTPLYDNIILSYTVWEVVKPGQLKSPFGVLVVRGVCRCRVFVVRALRQLGDVKGKVVDAIS